MNELNKKEQMKMRQRAELQAQIEEKRRQREAEKQRQLEEDRREEERIQREMEAL